MIYEIEVRPGSDSEYFQYYTETVEARTSNDALKRVERRNPGCNCTVMDWYSEDDSNGGSSSSGMPGGFFGVVLIAGAIGFFTLIGESDVQQYQPTQDNPAPTENINASDWLGL
tara:strand:+ start:566 stop:907 length:342 start_codon:yes stop_codon:yes gene_type:complete